MIRKGDRCLSRNHGRKDAPVRFCPICGEVVNEDIPIKKCSEERHAEKRRQGTKYCVDCGKQLIRTMWD